MMTDFTERKDTMKITSDQIILDTDPRIRTKSEPVPLPLSKEDSELLNAMITYVRNSQDDEIAEKEQLRAAVGIAAPFALEAALRRPDARACACIGVLVLIGGFFLRYCLCTAPFMDIASYL